MLCPIELPTHGRESGVRTHGAFRRSCFRDRCLHPDSAISLNWCISKESNLATRRELTAGRSAVELPANIGFRSRARTCGQSLKGRLLYQLSYAESWCPGEVSSFRRPALQAGALPSELPRHIFRFLATEGLEPPTPPQPKDGAETP